MCTKVDNRVVQGKTHGRINTGDYIQCITLSIHFLAVAFTVRMNKYLSKATSIPVASEQMKENSTADLGPCMSISRYHQRVNRFDPQMNVGILAAVKHFL